MNDEPWAALRSLIWYRGDLYLEPMRRYQAFPIECRATVEWIRAAADVQTFSAGFHYPTVIRQSSLNAILDAAAAL